MKKASKTTLCSSTSCWMVSEAIEPLLARLKVSVCSPQHSFHNQRFLTLAYHRIPKLTRSRCTLRQKASSLSRPWYVPTSLMSRMSSINKSSPTTARRLFQNHDSGHGCHQLAKRRCQVPQERSLCGRRRNRQSYHVLKRDSPSLGCRWTNHHARLPVRHARMQVRLE